MKNWTDYRPLLWAYELMRRYGEVVSSGTIVFLIGFYIGVITTNG